MVEYIMRILSIPLYLFEGYCIQFFFGRFAEPKLRGLKNAHWAAGIAWIVIKIVGGWLFRETDSVTLVLGLIFNTVILFAFCVGWYKGNMPLKIFLTIQFISLRELAFWAGYSFLYIGNSLIDILVHGAGNSMESAEYLPVAADVLACFSVAFMEVIEGVLLFVSISKARQSLSQTIQWIQAGIHIRLRRKLWILQSQLIRRTSWKLRAMGFDKIPQNLILCMIGRSEHMMGNPVI